MKPLLKVMFILTAIFASTFVAARLLGVLTQESVRAWLQAASEVSPVWLAATVFALLFVDIVIAVPTLTITLLAGYFLGFPVAFATTFAGTAAAAFAGYGLAARYGDPAIAKVVRDADKRIELAAAFRAHGPVMILLSRAAPMVPEVTACMAGATRMGLVRYAVLFTLSTAPYVGIASYAGSISTLEDPEPAIIAVVGLYGVLWCGWAVFRRRSLRSRAAGERGRCG